MKKDKKKHLERLSRRKDSRHGGTSTEPDLVGVLSMAHSGFGFVKPEDVTGKIPEIQEVFIPAKFIGSAMNGDTVSVVLMPPRPGRPEDADKGPCGRIVGVTKRSRDSVIGEVIAGHKVRPLSRKLINDIDISAGRKSAKRGEWVELKLIENTNGNISGKIVRSLGAAGSIQSDLDAICAEFGLFGPYSEEQNARAATLPVRDIEREDMTEEITLTIDPTDAKDFDDALSVGKSSTDGAVDVGVHIADVAAYITPKDEFDQEASKRGFTAYLPGRTLPMLPKDLTKRISLQAGAKSAAHSVVLTVDKASGKVLSSRRCHSWVRITQRMTYEEVQGFIDDPSITPGGWNTQVISAIKELLEVTRAMRSWRNKFEEFIDLAMPEIRIIADEAADEVKGLARKLSGESEFMVEECMLAANNAIGAELCLKQIPGMFRIHNTPDDEKLSDFSNNIERAFGFYPGDLSSRTACNAFLSKLPHDERRPMILSLFLRSLPRAEYSEKPELHFGLGKTQYCHFTSPIRRYTDLSVHQQLWNFDRNQRLMPTATMAKRAEILSSLEENNDNAYYTANDRLKLRYLQEKLNAGADNFYEGIVSKVTGGGLMAEIPDLGTIGFIPIDDLPGSFYRDGNVMREERGHKKYQMGDYIYLRLSDIDFARGQALFRPAVFGTKLKFNHSEAAEEEQSSN